MKMIKEYCLSLQELMRGKGDRNDELSSEIFFVMRFFSSSIDIKRQERRVSFEIIVRRINSKISFYQICDEIIYLV